MSTTSDSTEWSTDDDFMISRSDEEESGVPEATNSLMYQSPAQTSPRQTSSDAAKATTEFIAPFRHLPSVAERDHVLRLVQECEEDDERLRNQIDEAEKALQHAQKARQDNFRRITSLKWSISALARLPDEVFGVIFEFYVLGLNLSPWTLTKVSSSFRRSAFAARKIWTRIQLQKERSKRLSLSRNEGGRERCFNVAQLRDALSRSGKAPLDLDIRHCTKEMALILVAEKARWEYINLYKIGKKNKADVMQILFGEHEEGGQLQSAELHGILSDRNLRTWLAFAKPPTLDLSYCRMSSINKISWWSELRRLRLESPQSDDIDSRIKNAYSALSSVSPYLTYLEIDDFGGQYRLQSPLNFPELIELKLNSIESWWQFKADKLLKMCLKSMGAPPAGTKMFYPNLLELDYDAWPQPLITGLIEAPKLDLLVLRGVRSETSLVWLNDDGNPSNLAPKRLCLKQYVAPFKPLLDSLRGYLRLEELRLEHCSLHLSFFKALSARPSKKYPMHCPGLRQMDVLLSYPNGDFEKDRYIEIFKAIASMRERHNQPLSKLLVTWPDQQLGERPHDFVSKE